VTAWIALKTGPTIVFTGLGAGVALAALILILHYNKRATGARRDIGHVLLLLEPVIKLEERRPADTLKRFKKHSYFHDGWELVIFALVLLGTVVVTYFVTSLSR
jgi:hypothetical protein